ncbi:MAG: NAD(P)/FAD-dependent oxidoreductase [Flavobacteriales bacterium]
MRIVVIGGGAAGFFAALSAKAHAPEADVLVLEKSDKLLAKVRVSGGGRCNVTHHCLEPRKLARNYPRGEAFLRQAFKQWSVKDTIAWFGERGVRLKAETDGRMFPVTDDSGTIIQCLLEAAQHAGVRIAVRSGVERLERSGNGWSLHVGGHVLPADAVIVASGGAPKAEGLRWLAELGLPIVAPVPSLFTFNLPEEPITKLMGVVAAPVRIRVEGTDLESTGPLLVTHWGMSGPAVLRLSAWGARTLAGLRYAFAVRVDWCAGLNEEHVRERLRAERDASPKRHLGNTESIRLPGRLWAFLCERAGLAVDRPWGEVGKQELNRLVAVLTNDRYVARGKTTFKEEFVTAGGVDLGAVDPARMEARALPGLFFAGEVLDIDGITGGFNFQAAWTTGWIAGRHAVDR